MLARWRKEIGGRTVKYRERNACIDAHVDVTEAKQGRPPLNRDWRDKNIKPEGGMEGAKRRERG